MEKLIYVLWKPDGVAIERFRDELLGPTARRLIDLGARSLTVNLADERAVPGLRIAQMEEPPVGMVSIWLDSALSRGPLEQALAPVAARLAGYLVLESVPLPNTTHIPPAGERVPGLYNVAFLQKPDALTYEAWLEAWQGRHTPIALETQSTFLYVQNVLVRPLTATAPPWKAIVEEAFPAEAATDPMLFYKAEGSEQKLEENQSRLMKSCQRFIDFSRFETYPMSSYVLKQ